jgi:NAD(P)-dependent dehydrogenase (short-subunit alcohol dehydrogenase family)
MMSMQRKVLLVTGGGSGIGRAAALAAAREGARVAVADIDLAAAQETVRLITTEGAESAAFKADISRAAEVDEMVASVVAAFGRLDAAFNNAGVAQWQVGAAGKKLTELDEEAWNRVLAINLTGTWLCMKAEIRQMQAQGGGSIVNTASISGLMGMQRSGAYVTSKHGLIGLTKAAALEYAESGIRVNCICPGFTDTVFVQSAMALRGEQILASVPLKRLGQPEEIAEMALWLLSERARYVTGGAYPVDGGVMAG